MATLIQKLFKPKWQHAKADIRLAAVQTLEDQAALLQLAQTDPEQNIKLAAISRLNNPDQLIGFFNHTSSDIKQAALKRFLSTLLGFENTQDQIKAVASLNESQRLMQIATYAGDEELRQAALSQIQDEAQLFEFIMASPSAKARQIAAQRIESAEHLDDLQKAFKGKDKSLVKLAKEKRQLQLQKEEAIAETQAAIQKTLDQAYALTKAAFSPTFGAQVAHLKQVWSKQEDTTDEEKTRFNSFIVQAEKTLSDNQAQAQALEEARVQAEQNLKQQHACIKAVENCLETIKQTNKAQLADVSELIKQQQQLWVESENAQKADKGMANAFEAAIKALYQVESCLLWLENHASELEQLKQDCSELTELSLNQLIKQQKRVSKHQKALNWPDSLPDLNIIHTLQQLQAQLNSNIEKIHQDEKNQLTKVEDIFNDLDNAISAGHIKEAKRHNKRLTDTLGKISDSKVKIFAGRKHLLQNRLQELVDWQGFATVPKMEELCNTMESLIDSGKAADVLADEINLLQQEWKTLSGGDRKTTQQLWDRFKAAADKAYEPCREHFHQQGEERKINKEKREQLCLQLEQFVAQNDWAQTDWKAIPTLCEKAKEEWKSYSPVDRRDHKVLQERFNQVLGEIRGKLTEEYERNAELKQSLVDKITALLDEEDLASAIEQCKTIQEQWKEIPQAGRKDFALWKQFRAQCDALFNRRDEEKNQRKAAIDDAIESAEALLQQAKDIVSSDEAEASIKRAGVAEAQQQYAQLQVPKRVHERIRQGFSELESQLQEEANQAKDQAQKALWLAALELGQTLAALEQQNPVDTSAVEAAAQQLDATELQANTLQPLKSRVIALQKGEVQGASEQDLLNLCLELEITMGLESPAQDKEARMALQVSLLQSRMGQGAVPRQQQKADLTCRWLAQAAGAAHYADLAQRFESALARV